MYDTTENIAYAHENHVAKAKERWYMSYFAHPSRLSQAKPLALNLDSSVQQASGVPRAVFKRAWVSNTFASA